MEELRSLLVNYWPSLVLNFMGMTVNLIAAHGVPRGVRYRWPFLALGTGVIISSIYMSVLIGRNARLVAELAYERSEVVRISKMVK
jgi:hypothetical protein